MARDQLVYFHGEPGAPSELSLFQPAPAGVLVPDRTTSRPDLPIAAYLDSLAADIAAHFPQGPIRLVGFSLGTYVALEIARRLGSRVGRLDLISPAAPLETGNYLKDMAGRPVFLLARRAQALLRLMVWAQGWQARQAPEGLLAQIFDTAQGADADLARDPAFTTPLVALLRHCLLAGRKGYLRELIGYVRPWGGLLREIEAPTVLWVGELDNWTPPAMAEALKSAIPGAREIVRFPGLSHYSTLRAAGVQIFGEATGPGGERAAAARQALPL